MSTITGKALVNSEIIIKEVPVLRHHFTILLVFLKRKLRAVSHSVEFCCHDKVIQGEAAGGIGIE